LTLRCEPSSLRFVRSRDWTTTHNETLDLSFERIDAHVNQIDLDELTAATAMHTQPDRGQRLIAAYAVARPILVALTAISLRPATWRTALRIFTTTLDEVSLSFKAGKDLAVGDGGTCVEMEPKLPTD
jgi:hypothetical protein